MPWDTAANSIPLWLLYLLTAALSFVGFELGWQVGQRSRLKREKEDSPIGAVVGATLGLLAFLLAFTFSLAAQRLDVRKQLTLEDGNAIGSVYLHTTFLPEPQRSQLRTDLRSYAELHAQGVTVLLSAQGTAQNRQLQERIWANTAATINSQSTILDDLFIEAVKKMLDTDAARLQAGRNQVPASIWFALYLATLMAMGMVGYQFGLDNERRWTAVILLVLTFSVVIVLIADLDRPQAGFVQVSQQPILDVLERMQPPGP